MGTLNAWHVINTGEILRKEIIKVTDAGIAVQASLDKHEYGKYFKLFRAFQLNLII